MQQKHSHSLVIYEVIKCRCSLLILISLHLADQQLRFEAVKGLGQGAETESLSCNTFHAAPTTYWPWVPHSCTEPVKETGQAWELVLQ